MDIDRLEQLIEHGYENDCLDFKEQFHENKAELLHDILCLANNTQFQNAYILFGIDDKRVTTGVENLSVLAGLLIPFHFVVGTGRVTYLTAGFHVVNINE